MGDGPWKDSLYAAVADEDQSTVFLASINVARPLSRRREAGGDCIEGASGMQQNQETTSWSVEQEVLLVTVNTTVKFTLISALLTTAWSACHQAAKVAEVTKLL